MNRKEYINRLKELLKKNEKEVSDFKITWALSNNSVRCGDIITNGAIRILVDSIRVEKDDSIYSSVEVDYFYIHIPECIYSGVLCSKDGKKYKNGRRGKIYQSEIRMV